MFPLKLLWCNGFTAFACTAHLNGQMWHKPAVMQFWCVMRGIEVVTAKRSSSKLILSSYPSIHTVAEDFVSLCPWGTNLCSLTHTHTHTPAFQIQSNHCSKMNSQCLRGHTDECQWRLMRMALTHAFQAFDIYSLQCIKEQHFIHVFPTISFLFS